jgi:hypothetical protein
VSDYRVRARQAILVFRDNTVLRDNGVLHKEMKVGESTQLSEAITKVGTITIVRYPSLSGVARLTPSDCLW